MMIGSFLALMFYILAPVDLGLKKIFYTPMIATACVMTVLFVFSFILAVSGCETDIFVVMMMWKYNKSKHHYAGHRKKRYCCKFPDHPNLIFCTNIIDENGLCKGFHRFL